MATRWHIGAKDLRGAIAAYSKRFDLLEVRAECRTLERSESADSSTRRAGGPSSGAADVTPSLATLRRWRKSVPPHFDFAVVAGPQLSRAKMSDAAERELEAAQGAIDALQARCFVLRTPPDVTPATVWRERVRAIIQRFPRDATHFVWEPSGVWELEDAATQARAWGAVLAVDAARDPVPPGPVAYVRLRSLGETRSFGAVALERVVRAVGERREVFAIIETESAMLEAKRLRSLARAKRATKVGGAGRLVRPRGGIVVRDDEQE